MAESFTNTEMEAEVIDLIRQLNDFQIRFSATKVSKSIALQLMQPLEKLMNHISSFYIMPEELPRGKRKITDYTCSSEIMKESEGKLSKEVRTPKSQDEVDNCSTLEICADMLEPMDSRIERRRSEAAEIVKSSKKTPYQPSCGVSYKGGPEDKEFSDNVKKRIKSTLPDLRTNKDLFRYMSFALLDRICCHHCSHCPHDVSKLDQWIKSGPVEETQVLNQPPEKKRCISLPVGLEATDAQCNNPSNQPDTRTVLFAISELTQWYELGISLGLRTSTLATIQQECSQNTSMCKAKVVENWLKCMDDVTQPSWESLVNAIKGELIKDHTLAKRIEDKYINHV